MADQEVPVCTHHQRGYCKYGTQCHKPHNNEICKEKLCRDRGCRKRHPKTCKKYYFDNNCKHGENCAYSHRKGEQDTNIQHLEDEVKFLKSEIEKLVKNSEEMAEKLKIVQSNDKEIVDIKENIAHLNNNLSAIMVKMSILEVNNNEVQENEKSNRIKQSYFKCDQCDFISTTDITLKKHINTKHPDSQREIHNESESECYMCGEKFKNPWDYLKHLEWHKSRKDRLFECKLCVFKSIQDTEIRDHMINHVENVLAPNLIQMQGKYDDEIKQKLDTIKEGTEYEDDNITKDNDTKIE